MSRFDYDGGEEWDYGRFMLWEQAMTTAFSSKRGQLMLHLLEQALLDLPEPRLIEGRLAEGGQVCAVGAFYLAQKVAAGEDRDTVLARMEGLHDPEDWRGNGADDTARLGKSVGMAYTMAWRLGELNDDDFRSYTPEARYDAMLAWVRKAQLVPA